MLTGHEEGKHPIPHLSGGDEDRIVDLKEFRNMGWYAGGWLGLDPTDSPLCFAIRGPTRYTLSHWKQK